MTRQRITTLAYGVNLNAIFCEGNFKHFAMRYEWPFGSGASGYGMPDIRGIPNCIVQILREDAEKGRIPMSRRVRTVHVRSGEVEISERDSRYDHRKLTADQMAELRRHMEKEKTRTVRFTY